MDSAFIPGSLRPDWGARVSNGFGVYNIDWQAERGFDMDPAIMETTLTNALRRADDLVWFYTEEFEGGGGNWYVPGSMPEPWVEAVRAARETVVSVSDGGPEASVSMLTLYPNPATGPAHARFALAEAGPVRLALFDLLGREVQVLTDRLWPAGTHAVSIDLSALSPGLYLVRLEAGGDTRVRRFVVAR